MARVVRRRKRASPTDLYNSCRLGGDCIKDVVDKFEHKTTADRILQIGSSVVFFGNQGIGTGSGTGGRLGYRPLGAPTESTTVGTGAISRPSVIPESVSIGDILPVEAVDASSPSVIPTESSGVDVGTVEVVAEVYPPPSINNEVGGEAGAAGEEIELLPLDPTVPRRGDTLPDTIVTTGLDNAPIVVEEDNLPAEIEVTLTEDTPAEIDVTWEDVQPPRPRPPRPRISTSSFHNPAYHFTSSSGVQTESSFLSGFSIDAGSGGVDFGHFSEGAYGESIELSDLGPRRSTPLPRPRATAYQKTFYNRFTKQVKVSDLPLLSQPRTSITFDNPVFEDPDITVTFDRDVRELEGLYSGIGEVSRPYYTEAPSGRVRVSRIGKAGTLTTRSGSLYGPRQHYFHDISSITPADDTVEFELVGSFSGAGLDVAPDSETSFTNVELSNNSSSYVDVGLLAERDTFADSTRLVIGNSRTHTHVQFPTGSITLSNFNPLTIVGPEADSNYNVPSPPSESPVFPPSDVVPDSPDSTIVVFDDYSETFDLHPAYIRKRKKRKYRL